MSDIVLVLDSHKDRKFTLCKMQSWCWTVTNTDRFTLCKMQSWCWTVTKTQRQEAYTVQDVVLVLDSHKDPETESLPCARCSPGVGQSQRPRDRKLTLCKMQSWCWTVTKTQRQKAYPVQDAVLVLGSHKDTETESLPCARCSPGVGQSQRHRDRKLTLCKMQSWCWTVKKTQREKAYPVQDAVLVLDSHKDTESESLPCARCSPGVGQSQRHRERKLTLCKM